MPLSPIRVTLSDGRCLYEALPKQAELHRCRAPNVLYGGAAGGAKSYALRWHLVMACLQFPGLRCLLLRREFTELEQTHLLSLTVEVPREVAIYNASQHRLTFPNGSLIVFGHCNTDADFASYLSTEWGIIAIDEAGQFTPYMLTMLPSRLRTVLPIQTQFALTSNPGGVGHQWLMDRFILKQVRDGTAYDPSLYAFIPSSVYDNPYIKPEYIERLKALPEPERRRYLDGDWNLPSGNLFAELDRAVHWVPTRRWPDARHVVTADWGWTAPAPAVWWQADMGLDGEPTRHNAYQEWAPTETTPQDWAAGVVARSGMDAAQRDTLANQHVERVILDAAAWDNQQTGTPSPAELMVPVLRAAGIRLTPALKGPESIVHGVNLLHAYLQVDGSGQPALTISDQCPMLWEALVSVQRGDATKLNDPRAADKPAPRQSYLHLTDCARYYCQSRPAPAPVTEAARIARDPLAVLSKDERTLHEALKRRAIKEGKPMIRAGEAFKPKQRTYPWQARPNR